MYKRSVCEKVPLKNTLYFERYKIEKFLIENSSKVAVKKYFFVRNLSFLYILKYKVIFNGTFSRMLLMYVFFYIFNAIIFKDIKV
jgi:hypothetical protein